MLQSIIYVGCLIGSWAIAGWVTVSVMKVRIEMWMERTKDLEAWRKEANEHLVKHDIQIALLRGKPG